ncbi:MAG: hypothetical protein K1Y01_03910 [Vicinamibacteria bacterium]|nr:hypothetical protein [Vicinamibacteria bacterium]
MITSKMRLAALVSLSLLGSRAPAEAQRTALRFVPIGPQGGDVRSLARDPSDPQRVYAGTVDGILYASMNAGASWSRLEPGFPLRGASLDDILVTEKGDVFVSFWKIDGSGGGVARSVNRGASFEMIGASLEGEAVRGLARAASNPKTFVAVTRNGVFRSTDGAETFSRISPRSHNDLKMVGSVAIDPRSEDSILVGTAHLAWRTDNGGAAWRPIQQGMINDSDVMTLTLDRREPATVFATACTGIWRSRNAGASWTKVLGIPSVSRRTRAFAQDHDRPDTFYAGTTDGVYVSEDDARTFARTTTPGLVVNALVSLGAGRVLAGVEGEGMLVSTDFGRSWTPSNDGFRERLVRQIVPDEKRNRLLALTGADGPKNSALFELDRARDLWRRVELPSGREIRSIGVYENGELIAGTDDGVFQGTAQGPPWRRLSLLISGADPHPQIDDLHIRGSQVLVATDHGLFSSQDRGSTWALLRFGASRSVVTLAIASTGKVVVATALGVYAAEDGIAFKQVASVGLRGLKRLAFAPGSDSKIFAATSYGLLVSRDAGRSWFDTDTPLGRVTGLTQAENGKTIFAADADIKTVFVSQDGGSNFWPIEAAGLPSQRTFALAIEAPKRPGDPSLLIVAASGGGLLEARLEEPAATAGAKGGSLDGRP